MKKIILAFLMIFTSFSMFAQWNISKVSEELYEGSREDGKVVTIFSNTSISPETLEKVQNCLDIVWNIPGIQGTKASVNVDSDNDFHFIVYPSSLTYENVDLAKNLPSGMGFYYESALFYDVTLKVEELMPRVTGAYVSPKDLLAKLKSSTEFPDLYMYDEYVLERLSRLENAVMALSKKGIFSKPAEVDSELVFAIRSIYNSNPDLTSKEVLSILKEQGFTVSASDVAAVRLVYLGLID